jgi:hypothetical protein
MSDTVIVQYVGFEAKAIVREYSFLVRLAEMEPREFTLTIVNEAFNSRRLRYQDAPDICSIKLRHELAAYANHPLATHFRISETDLDEYRASHATKASRSLFPRKASQEV